MTAWFVAAENDYRGLEPGEPARSVAVVIPVYNRVSLLERTIAGLAAQDFEGNLEVVVADDGSQEDVAGALERFHEALDLTIVRRDHEGYGAGQARNLGARACTSEVVVFIDADCVPDPELVARHARWHGEAANLVVIGARHQLDTTQLSVDRLLAGDLDLKELAGLRGRPDQLPGSELAPTDWRRLLYRRTGRLRHGTEAFRSLVSSNFSVRRERFLDVGGFDEDFERWGGEDTELGWRLQNDGCFFVPDDHAINYHQIQEDDGPEAWREDARRLNDGMIRSKVPHRFYRRASRRGVRYEVPKVSILVPQVAGGQLFAVVNSLIDQTFTDWEAVLLVGDDTPVWEIEELRGDPRLLIRRQLEGTRGDALVTAIELASGELLAVMDDRLALDRRLIGRTAQRLDERTRSALVTVGIRVPAADGVAEHVREADVTSLLRREQRIDDPPFWLARRRDAARWINAGRSGAGLYAHLRGLTELEHLAQPLVGAALDGTPLPPMGAPPATASVIGVARSAEGPADLVRQVARTVKRRRARAVPTVSAPAATDKRGTAADHPVRVPVRYVGWVGHDNFGDEILLRAISHLLPWADLRTTGGPGRCLLLGGGTLINRGYLKHVHALESPRAERAVFGTGVANPEYWGTPREPVQGWLDLLETCALVGVRGPISEHILREWGYTGPLEVVGDPALAIERPDVDRHEGRIVVSLAQTRGELWGGDDAAVFASVATAVRAWLAEGREVHLWGASPRDDLASFELARAAGAPNLPYTAAYRDLDDGLALLASAGVVVGERLHGVVLAAACDIPFVALEYRPKLRDFAASVGMAGQVIRTDVLDPATLRRLVASTERDAVTLRETVASHVTTYRTRLTAMSEALRQELQ